MSLKVHFLNLFCPIKTFKSDFRVHLVSLKTGLTWVSINIILYDFRLNIDFGRSNCIKGDSGSFRVINEGKKSFKVRSTELLNSICPVLNMPRFLNDSPKNEIT